jgi:hypothetical protein
VPGPERIFAVERGEGFQRVADQMTLQEGSELTQLGQQAHTLGRVDGPRGAAGLDRLRVRPLAAQRAQQREPALARRRGRAHLLARVGREAAQRLGVPGPTGIHRAHEIGHEEQVEVRQVVGQVLGREDQVGRVLPVGGHDDAAQIGQRTRRRDRLRDRADAADARHEHQRVVRRLALQDLLEAAVHGGVDLRRAHAVALDLQRDFEIAFDAVERSHQQATHTSPRKT